MGRPTNSFTWGSFNVALINLKNGVLRQSPPNADCFFDPSAYRTRGVTGPELLGGGPSKKSD